MGNTSQKLNKIIETKAAIKAALINKNVNVSDDTKFSEYPALIESIEAGGGSSTDDFYNLRTLGGTNCSRLFYFYQGTELNLSDFNTSNVTTMSYMFYRCETLTTLDVSSFDTSNVTTMYMMFYECTALTSLDLSSFDTSNVTNLQHMFEGCIALTTLDLSNFDVSKVESLQSMFNNCRALHTLRLDNCSKNTIKRIINSSFFPTAAISGVKRTIYCKESEAAGLTPPTNWVFSYV